MSVAAAHPTLPVTRTLRRRAQMREWFEWDYFGPTTLVRHESMADLQTIEELFPNGHAFRRPVL